MTTLTFTPADPIRHRDALLALNVEYMTWTAVEIEKAYGLSVAKMLGMSVPEYVASVINKVCGDAPPNGSFYLVEHEGTLAGMGGLRRVRAGVCELKRVYVRPTCRGKRIGESIVERALADAAAFGFGTMVLDSGPFMRSAHRIYEATGFVDCAPYPQAEVPAVLHKGWRFMERQLGALSSAA